jgi:nucleoid DNA-binding protein
MADAPVLSPSRLHRLLPSDVAEIAKSIKAPGAAPGILKVFADYLKLLKTPSAVELDDVSRIVAQLNATGIWEKVRPEKFIGDVRPRVDKAVLAHLSQALDVEPATELKALPSNAGLAVSEIKPEARAGTVTLQILAEYLADDERRISKSLAQKYIEVLLKRISRSLDKGERVRLSGLGSFEKRYRHARRGSSKVIRTETLARSLARESQLPLETAEIFLSHFVGNIAAHLRKGERVDLSNLGVLVLRRAAHARGGTGSDLQIESDKIAIQTSRQLAKILVTHSS